MPSLYQVSHPSEIHGIDSEITNPLTIEDAFSMAALLEADAALFEEEHSLLPKREPCFVVQISAWGVES